ncbi:hypothetical protein [Streptomyces sp. TLI_146]|uniref:hypothetical protein n=1 Tax=Streptomyces sp. TLI_146 TaxID=1938858 RepID=UPI000C711851|nr:hypothetical protein [Streptomyces sp. TLI_146]PKV90053.1 hypothetical protein BX283_7714 [Streptomyces sp. TLI_146]
MMYDQERAQQPQDERQDPATRRGPQRPRTGPARTPHEPAANGNDPDRTPGSALLPQGERDKLTLALQQALGSFVESPRQAVEEADSVFGESVTRVTETLAERHRVLRASWQDKGTEVQTEELRLALRQYRATTELLLHL